jgi:SAM-dependent methyltransferase
MPNVDWNAAYWGDASSWTAEGEEWSRHWGSSMVQWYYTILPRISTCVPAARIVEIAPGYGRWTRFLLGQCHSYRGYDLSQICIDSCIQKFARGRQAEIVDFIVNDGKSLVLEKTESVDFVFSFDSLVHAEKDVIDRYLIEIARVLCPRGRAFLHHSNYGALSPDTPNPHVRGSSVSAASVEQVARAAGLFVLAQETISWQGIVGLDCLTLLAKPPLEGFESRQLIDNPGFWNDVARNRDVISAYMMFTR